MTPENKTAEIDKNIEMLNEVINYGYETEPCRIGYSGATISNCYQGKMLTNRAKNVRSNNAARLKAYTKRYATSDPITHWRKPMQIYNNLYDAGMLSSSGANADGIKNLQAELNHILQERTNQEQFLQNQIIEQADAKTKQEEEKIRLLQEKLAADKHKTEQERQKALQELEKAKQEAEKAKLAADLARQGGAGNIAAGKTLLGTWESKVGTNPWIIAGISVGALTAGVIVYKILG